MLSMLKWLFKRKKTDADVRPEIETSEDTGPAKADPQNRPKKKEPGRVYPKEEYPWDSPTFKIDYGALDKESEVKPPRKVLLSNGTVINSTWYIHPWLGGDGWLKQQPKYSVPKIHKAVEKDLAEARRLHGETISDRVKRREKEQQV